MANPVRNVPISEILKNKSTFEDEPRKKSREDWRKAKELEEARKAGTAPAAVDEEGKFKYSSVCLLMKKLKPSKVL